MVYRYSSTHFNLDATRRKSDLHHVPDTLSLQKNRSTHWVAPTASLDNFKKKKSFATARIQTLHCPVYGPVTMPTVTLDNTFSCCCSYFFLLLILFIYLLIYLFIYLSDVQPPEIAQPL